MVPIITFLILISLLCFITQFKLLCSTTELSEASNCATALHRTDRQGLDYGYEFIHTSLCRMNVLLCWMTGESGSSNSVRQYPLADNVYLLLLKFNIFCKKVILKVDLHLNTSVLLNEHGSTVVSFSRYDQQPSLSSCPTTFVQ